MDEFLIGLDDSCKARRVIKRVKTGCHTCKIRRVKCDEGRPACWQCSSSKRECKGYGIWGGGGQPLGPITGMLDLCQPTGNLEVQGNLRLEDRRVLSWFTKRTLSKIQGLFTIPFWEVLVPQCCPTEPIILACVLALGSCHRERTINWRNQDSFGSAGVKFSYLWYYGEAIRRLRGAQLDGSRHSTRIILIGCLLFIAIEYMQQRHAQGRLHLRNGLNILSSQRSRGLLQSSGDSADDWLTEAFNRLDLQTELLLHTTKDKDLSLYEHQLSGKRGLASLGSLDEARSWLDYLMSQAFQLQRQSYLAEDSENVTQLFQLSNRKRQLQQDLASWLRGFRAFKPQTSSNLKEQLAHGLLLAYYEMTTVITETTLSFHDEFVFDRYSSNFTSIITSCREVLAAAKTLLTNRNSASHPDTNLGFTTDMGIIRPLYYTALKCRVDDVRREALSMLHSQTHQEGIWDGSTAALIASEVVRLEEHPCDQKGDEDGSEGARCEHQSGNPQYSRISDAWIELSSSPESELQLTVRRRSSDGTWTIEHRNHNGICWR